MLTGIHNFRVTIPDAALLTADHGNGTATITLNATGVQQSQYIFWVTVHDTHD